MRFARTFSTIPSALAVFVLAVFLQPSPATGQEFSSLEERMSRAEFTAAGLDKLSAQELETLNNWLRGTVDSVADAAAATAASEAVATHKENRIGFDRAGVLGSRDADGSVTSRIKGDFRGWSRKGQRFELENGQIWEVTDAANPLMGVRLDNPLATIESGFSGAWYLRVEGYNTRAKVKRVK